MNEQIELFKTNLAQLEELIKKLQLINKEILGVVHVRRRV